MNESLMDNTGTVDDQDKQQTEYLRQQKLTLQNSMLESKLLNYGGAEHGILEAKKLLASSFDAPRQVFQDISGSVSRSNVSYMPDMNLSGYVSQTLNSNVKSLWAASNVMDEVNKASSAYVGGVVVKDGLDPDKPYIEERKAYYNDARKKIASDKNLKPYDKLKLARDLSTEFSNDTQLQRIYANKEAYTDYRKRLNERVEKEKLTNQQANLLGYISYNEYAKQGGVGASPDSDGNFKGIGLHEAENNVNMVKKTNEIISGWASNKPGSQNWESARVGIDASGNWVRKSKDGSKFEIVTYDEVAKEARNMLMDDPEVKAHYAQMVKLDTYGMSETDLRRTASNLTGLEQSKLVNRSEDQLKAIIQQGYLERAVEFGANKASFVNQSSLHDEDMHANPYSVERYKKTLEKVNEEKHMTYAIGVTKANDKPSLDKLTKQIGETQANVKNLKGSLANELYKLAGGNNSLFAKSSGKDAVLFNTVSKAIEDKDYNFINALMSGDAKTIESNLHFYNRSNNTHQLSVNDLLPKGTISDVQKNNIQSVVESLRDVSRTEEYNNVIKQNIDKQVNYTTSDIDKLLKQAGVFEGFPLNTQQKQDILEYAKTGQKGASLNDIPSVMLGAVRGDYLGKATKAFKNDNYVFNTDIIVGNEGSGLQKTMGNVTSAVRDNGAQVLDFGSGKSGDINTILKEKYGVSEKELKDKNRLQLAPARKQIDGDNPLVVTYKREDGTSLQFQVGLQNKDLNRELSENVTQAIEAAPTYRNEESGVAASKDARLTAANNLLDTSNGADFENRLMSNPEGTIVPIYVKGSHVPVAYTMRKKNIRGEDVYYYSGDVNSLQNDNGQSTNNSNQIKLDIYDRIKR